MSSKNFNMLAKTISKFFEIVFFVCSALMVISAVLSFARPHLLASFLLANIDNGTIATNGFQIMIEAPNGEPILGAVRIFTFAGIFTMLCMAMIFRNIYLIIKTCEGRTWFTKGKTPFQKDVVRMVREIGIFSIMIPMTGLVLSLIARISLGSDFCETSVQIVGIAMGIAMICFSRIFAYGIKLEEEVEGLI
ncbi:hypothetical protein [Treponema sp. UBA753]|uniref:hypothetical protein n=1 Tax=Treponema sp. UBA753 TaxID=1947747 RepID=UPI0025D52658|nr:hypothetical protein [Treponema sp. UBA753]